MKTLLLDTVTWDLVLDASGNIALASEPYALAQDASSAIRLFRGELYYDTTKGVPYLPLRALRARTSEQAWAKRWVSVLGRQPPLALLKAQFEDAAKTVPGVVAARCFISALDDRRVSGQVQVVSASASGGQVAAASF